MAKLRVQLSIPAERYVALYAGSAKSIIATAEGGLTVQFPGSALHGFVTHDGLHGTFELYFDSFNKLTTVKRIV
jgi:hypothetical protein